MIDTPVAHSSFLLRYPIHFPFVALTKYDKLDFFSKIKH